MSRLHSLFYNYNQDVAAVILNLLPEAGQDIVHLKISAKHFYQLINAVVPIHHFVHNLRCLQNNETPPPLEINNYYTLHKNVVQQIWNPHKLKFLKKSISREEFQLLITRFVLLHHSNPFCVQVIQWFPFHSLFLSVLCQYEPYKDSSETMKRIAIWERLNQLISQTNGVVTEKWLEEADWKYALFAFDKNQYQFCTYHDIQCNMDSSSNTMMKNIIGHRDLFLFLLIADVFTRTEILLLKQELLNHSNWAQYCQDRFVIQALLYSFATDVYFTTALHESFKLEQAEDVELIKMVVVTKSVMLKYLPVKWRQNKKVVLEAMQAYSRSIDYADERLLEDQELILTYARLVPPDNISSRVIEKYKDDVSFMKRLFQISLDGMYLPITVCRDYYPEYIKNDPDIVWNPELFDKSSSSDLEWLKNAFKKGKISLQYLPLEWRTVASKLFEDTLYNANLVGSGAPYNDDKTIALAAVKESKLALSSLSTRLRNDIDIIRTAVQQHGSTIRFAGNPIISNFDFVKELILLNTDSLGFILQHETFIEEWSMRDCEWEKLNKDQQQRQRITKVRECLHAALKKNSQVVNHLKKWEIFKKEIISDEQIMGLLCTVYGIQQPSL